MSVLKTLDPATAGVSDVPRGRQGALAIPTARPAGMDSALVTRPGKRSSSFHGVLAKAHLDSQTNAVRGDRSQKTSRSNRNGDANGSARSSQSSPSEKASRPDKVRQRPKESRDDEASQAFVDDADAAQAADRTRVGDDPEPREASPSDAGASAQSASGAEDRNDPASDERDDAESGDAQADGCEEWLRRLTSMGVGATLVGAAVQTGADGATARGVADGSTASPTAVASLDPPGTAGASSASAGLLDPTKTAGAAQGRGSSSGGLAATALASKATAENAGLPLQPAAGGASSGGDLARLVALAAGIAGEASPGSGATGAAGGRASGDEAAGPKPASSAGDAAVARADWTAVGGRTTGPHAGPAKAESFGEILARTQSTADDAAANVGRVAELVRSNIGARNSSVTIRLDPPELGQIQLDARLRNDVLSIQIQAETAAARDLLHSRLGDLREALARHGITLDRVDIEPRSPSPSPNAHESGDGHRDGGQQRADDQGMAEQWRQHEPSSWLARGETDASADGPVDVGYSDLPDAQDARQERAGQRVGPAAWVTPTSVNVLV